MSGTIKIKRMLLNDYKELRNVSKNKDVSFSLFMKQSLSEIAKKYEQFEKEKITIDFHESIVIRGVSEKTMLSITKICAKLGVDVSSFLKIELYRLKKEYPDNLKQNQFND